MFCTDVSDVTLPCKKFKSAVHCTLHQMSHRPDVIYDWSLKLQCIAHCLVLNWIMHRSNGAQVQCIAMSHNSCTTMHCHCTLRESQTAWSQFHTTPPPTYSTVVCLPAKTTEPLALAFWLTHFVSKNNKRKFVPRCSFRCSTSHSHASISLLRWSFRHFYRFAEMWWSYKTWGVWQLHQVFYPLRWSWDDLVATSKLSLVNRLSSFWSLVVWFSGFFIL